MTPPPRRRAKMMLCQLWETAVNTARTRGVPQECLVCCPPTCEFAFLLYFLFGALWSLIVLSWDTIYQTQVLPSLY